MWKSVSTHQLFSLFSFQFCEFWLNSAYLFTILTHFFRIIIHLIFIKCEEEKKWVGSNNRIKSRQVHGSVNREANIYNIKNNVTSCKAEIKLKYWRQATRDKTNSSKNNTEKMSISINSSIGEQCKWNCESVSRSIRLSFYCCCTKRIHKLGKRVRIVIEKKACSEVEQKEVLCFINARFDCSRNWMCLKANFRYIFYRNGVKNQF